MDILLYCFGILILFIVMVLISEFYKSLILKKEDPKNIVERQEREHENEPLRSEGKILMPKDQRNLRKALLRNRRQGHSRFMFHGNWYYTGLKIIITCHSK